MHRVRFFSAQELRNAPLSNGLSLYLTDAVTQVIDYLSPPLFLSGFWEAQSQIYSKYAGSYGLHVL